MTVSPDASGEPRLTFDPPALREAVTRVTRITVELPLGATSAGRVVLVEGVLTPAQLRDLARPALTQTLAARVRPTLVWSTSETMLVVAPLEVLAERAVYSIAMSDPPVAVGFTIAAETTSPIVPLVWPDPESAGPRSRAAVWCASADLDPLDAPQTLPPAGTLGRLSRGTGSPVAATRCLGWFADPDDGTAESAVQIPAVTPPSVRGAGGDVVLLEPVVLWPDVRLPEPPPMTCDAAEVPFGPACAAVEDDRVVVRAPETPVLWTIDDGTSSNVRRSRAAQVFVLRPLPARGHYRVATLAESGHRFEHAISVTPAPPRAHVVINEVFANPAGVERDQEWVELFNDGLLAIDLAGYGLDVGGRSTPLPSAVLAPGAFALVVPGNYVEDDGIGPVAAPGTILVRVPLLGGDGLSNDGERLVLRDGAGTVLSTFPPMKAKSGVSNERVAPDAPDDSADSFAPSLNGSATPGAQNRPP
jgi:hypothetical protein